MLYLRPFPLAPSRAGGCRVGDRRPRGRSKWVHWVRPDPTTLPPLADWLPGRFVASGGAEDDPHDLVGVKRFIEEHLAEPFDVTELSRQVDLTRPHFTRVFTECEGVPPWTYVLDRRVQRATELLEKGMPPSEVALESGFYDQSHLTRVFRRATGKTPGAYRRDSTIVQDGDEDDE